MLTSEKGSDKSEHPVLRCMRCQHRQQRQHQQHQQLRAPRLPVPDYWLLVNS